MTLNILLFFNLGGGEMFVVFVIILLLFGADKIPEFARGLGKGIRYFKDATRDIQHDIENSVKDVKKDVDESIGSVSKELEKELKDPKK